MAAKQGTLAQLSAQAEDAKRAVLSKAGASSWFSNLNTVCTIKSAPPRTPEVLQMLATKSGWLYKRNEQHVWQARWCCVVPHTFLYYFDAPAGSMIPNNASGSGGSNNGNASSSSSSSMMIPHTAVPGPQLQEEWNRAVQYGLGDRKPHEKRSHFPLFHGTSTTTTTATTPANHTNNSNNNSLDDDHHFSSHDNNNNNNTVTSGPPTSTQNLPPAGIIDLECYTNIHRSSENDTVLQLAGDDQVNPDLRAFYFCCSDNKNEVDEWSHAILNNRHSSLQDEVDAFKYVADSFAERLDILYAELNDMKTQYDENEQVLYRVRSAAEGTCRTVYRTIEESLDRSLPTTTSSSQLDDVGIDTQSMIQEKRNEYRSNLDSIRQQDLGIPAAIRLVSDYIVTIEDICIQLQYKIQQLQNDVQKSDQIDHDEMIQLQKTFEEAEKRYNTEKEQLVHELAIARAESQRTTKELKDMEKDLSSSKMEITMLLSQQRTKNISLLQIKKKLKSEVLDLRQKLVEVVSENTNIQHENDKLKLQLQQEKSKNDILQNYINKMENQVQVQQNMMELMSQVGGGNGSVYGGGMSINMNRSVTSHNNNNYRIQQDRHTTTATANLNDDDDDDIDNDDDDFMINNNNNNRDIDTHHDDVIDEDYENDERMLMQPPNIAISPVVRGQQRNRRRMPQSQRSHSYRTSNSFMSADNDMDNKSHLSELTEDRTQREFAIFQQSNLHHHHHSSSVSPSQQQQHPYSPMSGGLYPVDSGFQSEARARKRIQENVLATSPRPIITNHGPPFVIVGVKKNDMHSSSNSNNNNNEANNNNNNNNNKRDLETINNSSVSATRTAPTHGNSTSSIPPMYRSSNNKNVNLLTDSPTRTTGRTEATSITSGDHSTSGTERYMGAKQFSIAHQARMEADQKTTPVRVRLDEKSLSSLQQRKTTSSTSEANLKALANMGVIPNNASTTTTPSRVNTNHNSSNQNRNNSSPQHSQGGSGIWRLVESAVLGPRSDDECDESSSYDSEGSTRITDMTDDQNDPTSVQAAKRRFVASTAAAAAAGSRDQHHRDRSVHDEKKSTDSVVSFSNLSLQERSIIQREKQIQFLRQQGLIHNANDIKGGAGVSSVLDSGSVTSGGGMSTTTSHSILKKIISPH